MLHRATSRMLTEIQDAERAVDELDGRDINGRAVTLKFVVRDDWETGSGKGFIIVADFLF